MADLLKARIRASGRRVADRLVRSAHRIPGARSAADQLFELWYSLAVPPSHFYSPLPDIDGLEATRSRWYEPSDLPGIEIDEALQRACIERLAAFAPEQQALPSFEDIQAAGYGEGYGPVEAMVLHAFVRDLKPRRVLEVGSGVSTFFILEATQRNAAETGWSADVTCVEPYPREGLQRLLRERGVRLVPDQVQDVPLDVFTALESGDLLFIDSSHVAKIDSDVNRLCLEVLPRLQRGVVIHIHDIPFPYLTLAPTHPLHRLSLLWNEAAFVRAFLCGNRDFQILMSQSMLHEKSPDLLRRAAPTYDPARHYPDSLWLKKVSRSA